MKNVFNKQGFTVEKILLDSDEEFVLFAEVELIDKYKRLGICLTNLSNGGDGVSGYKYTDEQREACRKRQLGKKLSKETRQKMSDAKIGKTPNNAGKSYTVKKPFTQEHRQKLSDAQKGKKRSAESSLKKSLATKGKPKSEETKANMKAAWANPERRRQMSETIKRIKMEQKINPKTVSLPPPWQTAA